MLRRRATALVLILLLAGCAGGEDPTLGPYSAEESGSLRDEYASSSTEVTTTTLPDYASAVASISEEGASLTVYDSPAGATKESLPPTTEAGERTVLLLTQTGVQGTDGNLWHEAYLPVRPNGSKGWIRAQDVTVAYVNYEIEVDLSEHTLTLYNEGVEAATFSVGVGESATPTPTGTFFIKELLLQPDEDGAYGPYAYGLSGFSEVAELEDFNGGEGVIGIHGTNHPETIGTDVSHGCIRLNNDEITALVDQARLPLGTPVEIRA